MQPLDAGDPQTIGAYRILGRLGAGGMGRVFLGRSAGGRTVAVKVAHPHFALDDEFRARFRREVAAARRVGGEWTAPVLDADPDAPVPWVATGYVAGPTLTEAVADAGPLPAYAVRALGAGLAEALSAVHGLGLVHRDVKPSNVMLTLDGPRLIDFGIARATDGTASLTSTGVSIGSPGYMSPEQILSKDVTGAADVFSLGAVLAYAALGEAPFPGDSSAALLYKVVHEEPRLDGLDALDGELREVVGACLAKEAADRPSPEEVARRLAPGGAAQLVAAGWLPGPLVERAGRAAVRLLDLEPATAPPGDSGPVPFSSPAVGVFGPPPASFGSGSGGVGAGVAPVVPGGGTGTATASDAAGRVSFSLTTENSAPDARGRGRRRSCTVVLAVAGALAVVTVGGSVLLSGLSGDDSNAEKDSGGQDTPPAAAAGVPKAFTGTWEGSVTAGGVASQYSVKISGGTKGEDVARTTNTFGPLKCNGLGELASVTANKLRITDRADPARPSTPGCASGTVQVTYTLEKDGTLTVRAQGKGTGNPAGSLRRLDR
ncbi:serine/threonine-protein kinase [Streptomyces sp. ISL-100]|uniref:serine/threonine-protein kinase n=1 Tax=Streptomyces sp. ISL-100 TaxID=2819173 RepID=UPI001BEB5F23|nr:serine/threonine-protein kinase [Streptomyces sp. ISL-100]MBT2397054.1 serine/threonine protein kinase [Streptomyces sp. ISL-100]